MQYRKFGNTGIEISALGFGCMRFPEYEKDGEWFVDQDKVDAMLKRAYELGINYFDTAPGYCHEKSPMAVGHAVKDFRDDIYISTKFPTGDVKSSDDYRRAAEKYLKDLDTDRIDFFHFWGINKKVFDDVIVAKNLIKEAVKLKEEGIIRHISFSFHDDPSVIKYIIDRAPELETMLCQYNIIDRANEEMIAYAKEKGLGVVAMGPVGGGRLAAPTDMYKNLTGKESKATYELALKFVLGNKNITCALSGMENIDMLEKNVKVASLEEPMTEKEWTDVTKAMEETKKFSDLYCTGCRYCIKCPMEINIARIFEIYTHYNVYGLKEGAAREYRDFLNDKNISHAEDCTKCGYCETKCPQHLNIRDQLERVNGILSKII